MASTTKGTEDSAAPVPANVEKILNDFIQAAQKAFAERLSSVVLFGSAAEGRMRATSDVNVAVVLKEFRQKDAAEIAGTARLARAAIRLQVMYLLVDEIPAAIECFAQKFGDIVRRHRILYGPDPFEGVAPSRAAEIYRLRQVVLNLQVRMRQGFAEHAGQEDQLAQLLADMSGPLRTCAAALERLENQGTFAPKEALQRLVDSFGSTELSQAISSLSAIREARVTSGSDVVAWYFSILEIVGRIRSRAWSLQ